MTKCSGSEKKSYSTNKDTGKNTGYHVPPLSPVNTVLYLLPMCSEYGECSRCPFKKKDAFIKGKNKEETSSCTTHVCL